MRARGRPLKALVPLLVGIGLLTGCAPGSAGADPLPTAATPVPQTPTATPTPTPTLSAAPSSRVALACDQLADRDEVAEALGGPAMPVSTPDRAPELVLADRQWGVLSCAWAAGSLDELGEGDVLSITVVPDVSEQVWQDLVPLMSGGGSAEQPYGSESYRWCDDDGFGCSLDARLANGYWVSSAVSRTSALDAGAAPLAALLGQAVTAVSALGAPPPVWRPAGLSSYPAQPSCDELVSPDEVSDAFGAPVEGAEHGGPTTQLAVHYATALPLGAKSCIWQWSGEQAGEVAAAGVYATVTRLPGGSWAFPELRAAGGRSLTTALGDALLTDSTRNGVTSTTLYQVAGSDLVVVESPGWDGRDASTEAILFDLAKAAAG